MQRGQYGEVGGVNSHSIVRLFGVIYSTTQHRSTLAAEVYKIVKCHGSGNMV